MQDSGVRGDGYRSPGEVGASAAACALSFAGAFLIVAVAAVVEWCR